MSALSTIVVLVFVTCAALALVALANHLHTRQQILRQRCAHLRRRVAELEEIVIALEPVVESLAIPQFINIENLAVTRQALDLEPNSQTLLAHLERALALEKDLSDTGRPRTLNRLLESDADIALTRFHINEAVRVLRRQEGKETIAIEQLEEFISELAWAHLMVQVISIIGQGHKAIRRGSTLSAQAFYRKAQQCLMENLHSDTRRQPMIRELSEIIGGTRSALSLHLMPETRYNPPAVVESPVRSSA